MARPATGCIKWRLNPETGVEQWYARVTFPNGKRPYVELDPSIPRHDEAAARAGAQKVSDLSRGIGSPGETVSSWFGRYYKMREDRGDRSVDRSRDLFKHHIEPIIGTRAMGGLCADDLRRVTRYLRTKIDERSVFYARGKGREPGKRKPGMSHGTAGNVWTEITSACGYAVRSDDDSFRVLKSNPVSEVEAPPSGHDREQAALYPSELVTVLSCPKIRMERRRIYAVAAYTGLRQSELRGLRAVDVDLDRMLISVRGQVRTGKNAKRTTTKTEAGLRQVPIEPALLPLLRALVHARKTGPLLHVANSRDVARYVHRDLERAELDREEIWADDLTRKPFDFHGWRHTYLTHLAMHPDASEFMLSAAGHTSMETSKRYVSKANLLRRGRFGDPHPSLPAELYESHVDGVRVSDLVSDSATHEMTNAHVLAGSEWPLRGSKYHKKPHGTPISSGDPQPDAKKDFGSVGSPGTIAVDPDADLLALVKLATNAGDLGAARRALALIEARRQERAGVVSIVAARARRGGAG